MQIKNGLQQTSDTKPQFATLAAERQLHSELSGSELVGVAKGTRVEFTVPTFLGETCAGAIARIGVKVI